MLDEGLGFEDGGEDVGMAKLVLPPDQVIQGIEGMRVQNERTIVETGRHGLHAGEVSMPCRDDQGCVLQLAIELLHLKKVMCMPDSPFCDGSQVLGLLLAWQVNFM